MSDIRCLLDGSIWKYVPPAAGVHNMEKVTGSMSEHVAVASVSPNAEFSGTVNLVLNILCVMIHLEVIPVLVIQDTSLTTASCVKVT